MSINLILVHRYIEFYVYGGSRREIGQREAVLGVVCRIVYSVYADAARHEGSACGDLVGKDEVNLV